MAERLSLELELLDKVGGPAKKAAAALRSVEDQAKKTNKALDFSSEVGKAHDALKKLKVDPKGYQDLLKAQAHLREEREKLKKSMSSDHGGFLASFKHALPFRSVGDYFKGAFWGHLAAEGVEKIAEGFAEGAHKAVEIVYDGLKDAFKAISKEQERIAGYDLTLGKPESKEEREAIDKFSGKTAFSASQNQDMMLPLFRAGLTGKAATTAYATSLDLAAGRGKGADQGAVAEAVDIFAKIQQKGGITSKQLAGIGLGEKNVPAFWKDLGKQMHISAEAAEKQAKAGKIDPQILMNSITDAVNKMQGGKAGTGGERAGKGLAGMWNKLKELPEDFFEKLVESPALERMSKALGNVLEQLSPDSPTGQKIFESLERAFNGILDTITETFTPENIDAFTDGIKDALDWFGDLIDDIKLAGPTIKDSFSAAIDILDALLETTKVVIEALQLVGKLNPNNYMKDAMKAQPQGDPLGRWLFGDAKQAPGSGASGLKTYGDGIANAAREAEGQRTRDRAAERSLRASMHFVTNATVHVDAAGDPTHTGQKAGVAIAGGMTKELERARAEAGAQ